MINHGKQKIVQTLTWIGKKTKTDIMYLAKGGFWLTLGQGISMVSALATSIAFAHFVSKEAYGNYRYVLSLCAILALPTLPGMGTAVTRAVARGFEGTLQLGFKRKLQWGLLATVAGLCTAAYYYWQGAFLLAYSFAIASFFLPLANALDIYNSLVLGRKKFANFTFYNSITQASVAICIIAVLTQSSNIVILIATFYIANTLLNGVCFWHALRASPLKPANDPETIAYGKHLTYLDIIGTILAQADKVLIFHYLGAAELAIYAFAITPPEQVKGLLKNIQILALPKFAEGSQQATRNKIFAKAAQLSVVSLGIAGLYSLTAPFFFKLLFPAYPEAVVYSQVVAISIVGATTAMFLYTYLEAHKATKQLYQYNIFSNVLNLGILLPAVYFGGLWGAILARTAVRFGQMGLALWLVKKT